MVQKKEKRNSCWLKFEKENSFNHLKLQNGLDFLQLQLGPKEEFPAKQARNHFEKDCILHQFEKNRTLLEKSLLLEKEEKMKKI